MIYSPTQLQVIRSTTWNTVSLRQNMPNKATLGNELYGLNALCCLLRHCQSRQSPIAWIDDVLHIGLPSANALSCNEYIPAGKLVVLIYEKSCEIWKLIGRCCSQCRLLVGLFKQLELRFVVVSGHSSKSGNGRVWARIGHWRVTCVR